MQARERPSRIACNDSTAAWPCSRGLEIPNLASSRASISSLGISVIPTVRSPCTFLCPRKIGRASCRERGCQYVYISVVAVTLKHKQSVKHQKQPTKKKDTRL